MKANTLNTNIKYYAIYVDADGNIQKWRTVKSIVRFKWNRFRDYDVPYYLEYWRFVWKYGRRPNVKDAAAGL